MLVVGCHGSVAGWDSIGLGLGAGDWELVEGDEAVVGAAVATVVVKIAAAD